MRLIELTLDRYGPFTGRSLTFRPDAALHVVLGANEAGKSTSLAAITDLLYGIPRDTRHAFLHRGTDLALSAHIRDRSGRDFRFTRRRNKPQLADETGRELGPEALAPFLGGVGRSWFERAFGLDAAHLRESGNELRDTNGELGAALFSATAGLRGLETLRAKLAQEAEVLFLPNGKKRRYNEALNRLRDAKKAEREAEITATQLRQIERDIADAETRLVAIAGERRAVETERARLDMLRRARPLVARRRRLTEARDALGALPAVEAGIGADYLAALAEAEAAARSAEHATRLLDAATREADAIRPDTALLERDLAVAALVQEAAALRKAERDVPGLTAEADRLGAELDECAARLGLADGAAVAAGRLDDGLLARLARLIDDGRRLADAAATARDTRRRHGDERARQAAEADEAAAADPAPLRESFAAVRPALEALAAAARERAEIAAETTVLAEEALRLEPSVADLDRLAGAALPSRAAIDAAAVAAAEHLARCRDAERDVARAEAGRDDAAARVAAISAGGDLPTAERIAEARAARAALWLRVRTRGEAESVAAFEAAVAEADRLADAAIAEAERVGSHRRAVADLQLAEDQVTAAVAMRADVLAARAGDRDAWGERWAALGIRPLAPEAMRAWRADLDGLFARRAAIVRRAEAAATAETAGAAIRPALSAIAAGLDLTDLPDLPAALLGERVARALSERERAYGAALERRGLVAGLARAEAEAEAAEAAAAAALAAWRQEAGDLRRLGVDDPTDFDAALARLAIWRTVPERISALAERRRRLGQLAADQKALAASLAALVAAAAPDLAHQDRDGAVAALDARLGAAREARTRREAALRRIDDARSAAEAASATAVETAGTLKRLAGRLAADAPAADTLTPVAERLAERDRIGADLAALEDQIGHVGDGADPADLDAALADLDEAAHLAAMDTAETRRLALEGEASAAQVTLERARRARAEGGDNRAAEIAAQERRMAEADLAETAETWLVLALAGALLGRAIEAKRGADHGPMMARASALFAALTGGGFTGLGQTYDDRDQPHLVGRRVAGAEVGMEGMSEGTRDQLFLALRLAYLESFARDAEPPPFVGDDLFASFDDQRTRHGLKTLAAVGATVQPILFTHHGRVAEMARQELGAAVDVIEL